MNQIAVQINSMGMKIKASKCRSFSLTSGKPSKTKFDFEGSEIPSISDEEQKFLGRVLFYQGKSEDCYNLLKEIIQTKLENLNKTSIRNEYKLEIYQMYILPSLRFLLTVHDLPQSYLSKLDTMTDQYLKSWAGLPRSATNIILHQSTAMNIKKISTLYTEAHSVTHCSTRLKGDRLVNSVLDNKLQRESKLQRKLSITVTAEKYYQTAAGRNSVQGEIPGITLEGEICESDNRPLTLLGGGVQSKATMKYIEDVKADVKSLVQVNENEKMLKHVQSLVKQGKYLELSQLEQTDATWQGYIYNLPRGTTLKPDIVIVEKSNKTVTIFELTIPAEHRIKSAHELKFQKYQHFISDIQTYTVKVIPFEIGSHTGYISSDNKKSIHSLHKFCEKNITLKKFSQNISAITVLSSYYIFNARNQDNWETMDTIQAPFNS